MKYVWFDLGNGLLTLEEHDTQSGTLYGHANAAGAEAVGAAPWYNTVAFGPQNKPECAPACLELFSSAGGVPILFDRNGRRFPFPLVRIKPGLTGPDGGNTTFFIADLAGPIPGTTEPDGFPNFFGTSASAPHVAAIAALMLDQRKREIAAGKRFGFVDASVALRLTAGF
jgi:subtilisin family serine protease